MILVTSCSLLCMSVFQIWYLSLGYILLITAITLVPLITLECCSLYFIFKIRFQKSGSVLVFNSCQAPHSGRRSFRLSLTALNRPIEILGHFSNKMSCYNQISSIKIIECIVLNFAKFWHFWEGLAVASRVNFERQTLSRSLNLCACVDIY